MNIFRVILVATTLVYCVSFTAQAANDLQMEESAVTEQLFNAYSASGTNGNTQVIFTGSTYGLSNTSLNYILVLDGEVDYLPLQFRIDDGASIDLVEEPDLTLPKGIDPKDVVRLTAKVEKRDDMPSIYRMLVDRETLRPISMTRANAEGQRAFVFNKRPKRKQFQDFNHSETKITVDAMQRSLFKTFASSENTKGESYQMMLTGASYNRGSLELEFAFSSITEYRGFSIENRGVSFNSLIFRRTNVKEPDGVSAVKEMPGMIELNNEHNGAIHRLFVDRNMRPVVLFISSSLRKETFHFNSFPESSDSEKKINLAPYIPSNCGETLGK